MSNVKVIICNKIKSLSGTKKFRGLNISKINKLFPNTMKYEDKLSILYELEEAGKIIKYNDLYFPKDWDISYSNFELNIIKHLEPVFKTGKTIEINNIITNVSFINEDSLEYILLKLTLDNKIIQREKFAYYDLEIYNKYLEKIYKLNFFDLIELKNEIDLKRNDTLLLIDYLLINKIIKKETKDGLIKYQVNN